MSMRVRATAFAMAASLGMGVLAGGGAALAAASVRVKVLGIDRDGQRVPVAATIYSTNDAPVFASNGQPVTVPTGDHWIASEVDTPGPASTIASEALVLRFIDITRGGTVLLDARSGKKVTFSLAVPGASDDLDQVQACVGGRYVPDGAFGVGGRAGTVYAVPASSHNISFGYGSAWSDASAGYEIAGQSSGGIPASVHHQAGLSSMAKLGITLRSGTTVGRFGNETMQAAGSCGIDTGLGFNPSLGPQLTQYVTAGTWTTEARGPESFWGDTRKLAAGHSYGDTFGGAVFGPDNEAPRENGGRITFFPSGPFTDPAHPAAIYGECCDKSGITLSKGGHVIKHQVLTGQSGTFSAHTPAEGWYTLHIKAWRSAPGHTIPAGMLSRQEAVTWYFHAAPNSVPTGFDRELPAEITRVWARGLDTSNQAPAGGTTTLTITVVRTHDPGITRTHTYAIKTVQAQASFDGGKTWHDLALTGSGLVRHATVQDPASGFVALRTVVSDSRGDKSTQVTDQAYAIVAAPQP